MFKFFNFIEDYERLLHWLHHGRRKDLSEIGIDTSDMGFCQLLTTAILA